MIYVNLKQANLIKDVLQSNVNTNFEDLSTLLQKTASIDASLAEAYIQSWRYNHPGGELTHKTPRTVDSVRKTVSSGPHTTATVDVPYKPPRDGSIIQQIIAHHKSGKTKQEIVALGFNKNTVGIQVGRYIKSVGK